MELTFSVGLLILSKRDSEFKEDTDLGPHEISVAVGRENVPSIPTILLKGFLFQFSRV